MNMVYSLNALREGNHIQEEQGTEKSSPYPNGLSRLSRANKPNREDRTKVLPVLFFACSKFTFPYMKGR